MQDGISKTGVVNKRIVRILDIMAVHKKLKVTLLADMLGVSTVTVRRDLENLEQKGIIQHIHGYACLDGDNDAGKRLAFSYQIKRKIAKAAAATVGEGETIMIESGSCCALFAEELALSKKNVTIITNSIFIMNYLCRLSDIKIILLGGYYQPDSQVLIGPMTAKCGDAFFSENYFLGADGFLPGYGFTGRDHLRVETASKLAERAKNVYILTEADKFNRRGSCNLIQFNKIAGVFTDEKISKEAEEVLLKNNVCLHKVPADEALFSKRNFSEQQFRKLGSKVG